MIKVPNQPFKISSVDEDDPFISNALRSRKHFEPCWCGSGKKFKKCHRSREQEEPISLGELQDLQRKVFWRRRGCMHPLASPNTCSGRVIDSHTIQRKGPLEKIADDTSHVMHFEPNQITGELSASKIGWRKASVFPGYCSGHDASLFSLLEREPFTGEHRQCLLQSFRNVCNELYRRRALIESLEYQRDYIDRGRNLDAQIELQLSYVVNIEAQKKSLGELDNLRIKFETAIINNQHEEFNSRCYFFYGDLDVVSSSVFQCEYDFTGKKLADLWDLKIDAEMLSHSVMSTDQGGAIVFVWLKNEKDPGSVVESFYHISNDKKGDLFVQYCFLHCENTFFSERWWESLYARERAMIQSYASALYYEGGEYVANKNRLVNWTFL